jgi:hypothetical protein
MSAVCVQTHLNPIRTEQFVVVQCDDDPRGESCRSCITRLPTDFDNPS